MVDVVVVRLNSSNLVYYLSPNSLDLNKNDSVVFESEKPGVYTLVKAQTAIEPKSVSATPNFKVYTSEDGLTVYGQKLDMGTVLIIK